MAGDPFAGLFGPGAPVQHTQTPRQEGISVGGFLGNLVGGVPDVVSGLTGILSGTGADVIKLATGNPHGLFLPHFAAELPGAVLHDIGQRYGSPIKVARGLYENPLSYLFDALAVGDIAGKVAKLAPETAFAKAVLPADRFALMNPDTASLPKIHQIIDSENPVTRFMVNSVKNRFLLPMDNLLQEQGKLQAMRGGLGPLEKTNEAARLKSLTAALDQAKMAGVDTYTAPRYAKYALKRAIMHHRAQVKSLWMYKGKEYQARADEIMRPLEALVGHKLDRGAPEVRQFLDQGFFGVNDSELHQFNLDELTTQIQADRTGRGGFTDVADAANAVRTTPPGVDPRVDALGHDEKAALIRLSDPQLTSVARADAHMAFDVALAKTEKGLTPFGQALKKAALDGTAKYAVENGRFATYDDFYKSLTPQFLNEYAGHPNDATLLEVGRWIDQAAEVTHGNPAYQPATFVAPGAGRPTEIIPSARGNGNGFDVMLPDMPSATRKGSQMEPYLMVKEPVKGENVFRVGFVNVHPDLQRQGIATDLYEAAANEAARRGGVLRSDTANVTPEAQGVWRKLVAQGKATQLGPKEWEYVKPEAATHVFPSVDDLVRSATRSRSARKWYDSNRQFFGRLFGDRTVMLPGGEVNVAMTRREAMGALPEGVTLKSWAPAKSGGGRATLIVAPVEKSLHELFANFLGTGSENEGVPRNLRIAMDSVIALAHGKPFNRGEVIAGFDVPDYVGASGKLTPEYLFKQTPDPKLRKLEMISKGFTMDRWPASMKDSNWKTWHFRINNWKVDQLALTGDRHFWRRFGFNDQVVAPGERGRYWDHIMGLVDQTVRKMGWTNRDEVQAALWDDQVTWAKEQAGIFARQAAQETDPARAAALSAQAEQFTKMASAFGTPTNFVEALKAPDAGYRMQFMMDSIDAARRQVDGPDWGVKFFNRMNDNVKGSIEFGPDYKSLITFYRTGDASTLVHEVAGHLLRHLLTEPDAASLEKAYGVAGGTWTRAAEEAFAHDVQHYFDTRMARPEVLGPIKRLFEHLGNIWKGLRQEDHVIPRETQDLLDRVFADQLAPNPNMGYERWARPLPVANLSTPARVFPPVDPGTLQTQVQEAFPANLQRMRDTFGAKYVFGRKKSLERIIEKQTIDGTMPTDAMGFRVTLDSYLNDQSALQELGRKYPILSIEDTRGTPGALGERKLAATVMTPEGVPMEVEFGTPEYGRVRDATATSNHAIEQWSYELQHMQQQLGQLDPADPANAEAIASLQNDIALSRKKIEYGAKGVQSVWEGVSDEIAKQKLGQALPGGVKRQVMNEYRTFVYATATKPLIDMGMFDPAKAFDAAYVPLRMQSGAVWTPTAGEDGNGDFVGGLSSDRIHAERMANDQPMPIYFPFYDARKSGIKDYLSGTSLKSGFMGKINKPEFLRTRTGELYLKDAFVTDPRDALVRRALAALRVKEMGDWYRVLLEQYGRPVKSDSEVNSGTEYYTAPMGAMQYFNAHIGLTDTLLEKLSKELKLTDQQVQQLVDDFMPQIQKNVLSMTKRGVQGYAIPKIVRDMAEQHIILPGYENAFRLFWDTPNKVWRSMVLTARPAWVANNVLGNVVFTAMQGGSLVRVGRQFVNPKYARLMEDIVPAEQAAGVGTGLFAAEGPGAATHLGAAAATGPGRFIDAATQTWHDTRGFRTMHQWGERIRNWNSEIENAFRRESFLTGVERQTAMAGTKRSLTRFSTSYQDLQKIAAKGIHPDIAEKALNEVNYFFNDYNSLGPFERGYIRRFALPFYSFFKHIVRLSTRYPMDFGLRNEVLTKLATFDNEMMRQMFGAQPAWMRGAYPIGPVGTPGGDQFFSGAAANPFSMLNPVASLSPMQLAYPLWKIAVETGMGRSTLTGRQFTDANVVVPFGTEQQYRIVTDSQGNVIDRIPINSVAPSIPESFAQQIPLYSLVKQLVAGGRTPSTETLPTVIKDRLLGRNPRELNAAGQALPFNALAALGAYVGLPTRQFDMAAYQANLARGGSEAAATYLKTHPPSGQATSVPPALRSQSSGGDPFAGLFG